MRISVLVASLLASGCAYGVDAPSLAPRAVERPVADRSASGPASIAPAALTRIVELTDQAQRGDAKFQAVVPRSRVAAPSGSDAWVIAQSAVSAADLARGPTLDALAALDTMLNETYAAQADATAIEAARAQVQAIVDRQNAKLDGLSAH